MYAKVLIALAPDHQVTLAALVKAAKALCPDGMIEVLTVIEPIPEHIAAHLPSDQQDRHLALTQEGLERDLRAHGRMRPRAAEGNAAQVILHTAKSEGFDCILLASHKPGLSDYFLGSTAARVVRHANCSVHVLR